MDLLRLVRSSRGGQSSVMVLCPTKLHQTGMHPFATDEDLHRYCYGETMFDHSCGFRVDKLQLPTLRKNADAPSVESISVV